MKQRLASVSLLTTTIGRHIDKATTSEYDTSALYANDVIVSRPEVLVSPMTSSARLNGTLRTGSTSVSLHSAHLRYATVSGYIRKPNRDIPNSQSQASIHVMNLQPSLQKTRLSSDLFSGENLRPVKTYTVILVYRRNQVT